MVARLAAYKEKKEIMVSTDIDMPDNDTELMLIMEDQQTLHKREGETITEQKIL